MTVGIFQSKSDKIAELLFQPKSNQAWRYHELLTWRFEHFVEQALAERRRGATRHAVGPALKNPLEQKSLSSCGLDSEMRELENALGGQDWRPFAPTEEGTWDKGNN